MSRFSLLSLIEPSLPASCEPENDFLRHFSATFHTCIPTNLAFISSLLGTLSIVSWLFAQLPQIYKNHQLKSTSGLSIFFLAEWLLGDLSNLLGSIFTRQALWQVIIAGYYCSVDCALVGQWLWYEYLKHGRPLRSAWGRNKDTSDDSDEGRDGMAEVLDGVSVASTNSTTDRPSTQDKRNANAKAGLDVSPQRSNPMDVFRIPNFARSPSSTKEGSSMQNTPTPTDRAIYRIRGNSPMPSPKTILYISLLLALISNTSATPIAPSSPLTPLSGPESSGSPVTEAAGKILSWLSTLLYLGSRLPQLYKNHIRRSTAGLSPTLFAAAFFGNLFYSSSLLTNPCAWNTYPPGSGRGWVEPEGSIRFDWVVRAAPFFLGAAGVLVMDAAVGAQFWYFGDGERGRRKERDGEVVVIVDGVGPDGQRGDNGRGMRWRWRRVSGWMRGWVPSVSVAGTPRVGSPAPSERDAVAEARALLGAGRCERTYGGV